MQRRGWRCLIMYVYRVRRRPTNNCTLDNYLNACPRLFFRRETETDWWVAPLYTQFSGDNCVPSAFECSMFEGGLLCCAVTMFSNPSLLPFLPPSPASFLPPSSSSTHLPLPIVGLATFCRRIVFNELTSTCRFQKYVMYRSVAMHLARD